MKSFNVVVTVSTTICVDANTPEDAIKKVQKALDANDAGTAILRNHEVFGKMTCRDWKNWLLDDAEPQFGIWF